MLTGYPNIGDCFGHGKPFPHDTGAPAKQPYVHPGVFKIYEGEAKKMGFTGAACGPMDRSSNWAGQQAHSAGVA